MATLFIFRRDLRIADNTGLIDASGPVIPAFIFDPRQSRDNDYFSPNAFRFMLESLKDLEEQIKSKGGRLYIFHGEPTSIIDRLSKHLKLDSVIVNRDYTPFSRKRDKEIEEHCSKTGIAFSSYADSLLIEPEQGLKADNTPYTVYTPFMKNARKFSIPSPAKHSGIEFYTGLEHTNRWPETRPNPDAPLKGGRKEGLKIIRNMDLNKSYPQERDIPSKTTTRLSAHNKFGTVSVREAYHSIKDNLGINHVLINQLFWRDFYTHIAYHFPYVFKGSFRKQYDTIKWKNDEKQFDAWCKGLTGFPIVDAGMRELVKTGYMHNRLRMIVASFLVKDLHIDWRWGEKFFAKHLIDYDPSVNNGNWQWSASTGCDAQPYFRIFNPWLQQKKFDNDCRYIKTHLPELTNQAPQDIHNVWDRPIKGYPRPIVDHKMEKDIALASFKAVR